MPMTGRAMLRFLPIGLTLALVAAACGGGGTKTVTVTTTVATPGVQARIYLLRDGFVAPVARIVPSLDQPDLAQALQEGPTRIELAIGLTTAIPKGSQPLPIRGGGLDRLALAQYTYTLGQADPAAPVKIGNKTYTRADFEDQTPAILVESPLPFTRVSTPLRLTGTANTFEATFQYEVADETGKQLAHHYVTATSGNGVRGTYNVLIPFTVSSPTRVVLSVYEVSAENGRRVNQVDIPVTLVP
jgi:hypothetical protein